jgi:hypothetical protein
MTQIITTGNHPKAMWPGIWKWWTTGMEHPTLWTDLVDQETSDKAYEEVPEDIGFNLITVKPEGDTFNYQTDSQGPTSRFTHVAYAGGYMVTFEEMEDNLYPEVGKRRTQKLARAARATHETIVASMYNRAFTGGPTGADGVSLINTAHPCQNGNQSNAFTASDLSEVAIEDGITQIMNATDSVGLRENMKAMSLHVAPANWAEATRIVKSVLQNDTANNAVNAIRLTGQFPNGIKVNPYFDDADAWFVRTDAQTALLHFQRNALSFSEDGAFDNKVQKYACYERYSVKWANWRGLYGNAGA